MSRQRDIDDIKADHEGMITDDDARDKLQREERMEQEAEREAKDWEYGKDGVKRRKDH